MLLSKKKASIVRNPNQKIYELIKCEGYFLKHAKKAKVKKYIGDFLKRIESFRARYESTNTRIEGVEYRM